MAKGAPTFQATFSLRPFLLVLWFLDLRERYVEVEIVAWLKAPLVEGIGPEM